jgi:hypothetical protein
VYPVRGQVFFKDKPAEGAVVTLTPSAGSDTKTPRPQGAVEEDGSFSLNTFDLDDGAPEGDYAVTIRWAGKSGRPGPDLLKGRYSDPKRPIQRVTIRAGDNNLEPIRLK